MKAKDIMSQNVQMTDEEASVPNMMRQMLGNSVTSLIVNRSNEDDSYGIVTRRDIINKIVATGADPYTLKAKDIMTKPLFIVTPNLSVRDVARLMVNSGVRRMPVFDGHRILGVVSNSDIFVQFGKDIECVLKENKKSSSKSV